MRFFPLALLFSASLSRAIRIPVTQRKHLSTGLPRRAPTPDFLSPFSPRADNTDDGDGDIDISSFHDLLYIANVTIAGAEHSLQLDTGSSDLWVKGDSYPLANANHTSYTLNITYGIGYTYGHIAYADVEFAGINVTNQAFIDANQASNPILSYGVDGIVGLGFTKLSSVDHALTTAGISDGKSLLYNMFSENPSEPNFIAFSLQRTTESQADGDVDGSFTIGEYEPEYTDVQKSNKISTFPQSDPTRWTVLLDALLIANNDTVTPLTSTVSGAPSGKAVVMLDSGTSYTYAPVDICDTIYGRISGAKYDASLGQWVVPCDAEIDIALQFGNDVYPLHPIDVSPLYVNDNTMCVGSFVPQSVSVGAGQFDWLIGDNVMRSLYTVYDFGDFDSSGKMGNPYMQLLSLVDPNKASQEFHAARGGSASSNIAYKAVAVSTANASARILHPGDARRHGLNALVVLILLIAGLVYFLRKRRTKVRARRTIGRSSPMPLHRTSSFGPTTSADTADNLGTYQPVSMALTEDTFVPPTPAFSKPGFEGNSLRGSGLGAPNMIDRPKSVA
ncbi:acid protease [Epithele typhae]|uniref:acid protease n=1 Tax=Epithele typhae TaxID=378194 RepID=UPI002007E2C7|nr:acid protease [Epithele typhae]KAH9943379.1 acid protease [Epithele typhae]